MIRQVATSKPLKLNLAGLVTSQSLDYILSGLKNNAVVHELNLSDNLLNDEDLTKICQRLRQQPSESVALKRLKLHSNEFREPWPFLDLLNDCSSHYTHLNFSNMVFSSPESIQMLSSAITSLKNIQELAMCGLDMFGTSPDQAAPKVVVLFSSIGQLRSLRCLDLSKNKLPTQVCLKMIETMPRLPRLQTLVLSQVNLTDAVVS